MNEPMAVQRYVSGDEGKARLRPVLISIMENFQAEQAADMILGLVDVQQRETVPLEEETPLHSPQPRPRRKRNRKRLAAAAATTLPPPDTPAPPAPPSTLSSIEDARLRGGPRFRAPPPLPNPDSGVRALEPTEWYTLAEAGIYLGLKDQMIRNLIAKDPEALPRKTGALEEGGHPRTLLLGRGIIALRTKRERLAAARVARGLNGHDHDHEDDGDHDEGDGMPRELGGDVIGRRGFGPYSSAEDEE